MSSEQKDIVFNPSHPKANIHGMIKVDGGTVCQTKSGTICTGCCTALRITKEHDQSKLLKEEGENCPAQIIQKGCRHVIENNRERRFWVCPKYHCSADIVRLKQNLSYIDDVAIHQRLGIENNSCKLNGEIDDKTYYENILRIPKIKNLYD